MANQNKYTCYEQYLYNAGEKIIKQFYKIIFLETCFYYRITPKGLGIKKQCQSVNAVKVQAKWNGILSEVERQLLSLTIEEDINVMYAEEVQFWETFERIRRSKDDAVNITSDWLTKFVLHVEKFKTKLCKQKLRKLLNLSASISEDVKTRFLSRVDSFRFHEQLHRLTLDFFPEVLDVVNLLTLNDTISDFNTFIFVNSASDNNDTVCGSDEGHDRIREKNMQSEGRVLEGNANIDQANNSKGTASSSVGDSPKDSAAVNSERLTGKFVSKNVVNLSKRKLNKAEISLLSKGLKFIPTSNFINRAKIKEDLEAFGRKLRLKWHFRNETGITLRDKFVEKSKFNPKGGDAAIEVYLSCLEDKIMNISDSYKPSYNNLTRDERSAMHSLRNDTSIVIKEADKGSAVVVWDREDYVKEAMSQLNNTEVYEETTFEKDKISELISKTLGKMKEKGEISDKNVEYFMINNPKLARFYLLPKIHKRLFNVPGRPVVSHTGFFTERISSFVDFHLQPLAQKVKSYIKDTNDFLHKLKGIINLPKDAIMCTIDVVGLYPSIPHDEGLVALREALDKRGDKKVSTESLAELAEIVLNQNIFEFDEKILRQLQGTAIGTKMAPPYAILFLAKLEEDFLNQCEYKPTVWYRYIDDIFMVWTHGDEKLKQFLDALNSFHDTVKFTSDWSRSDVNFLDVKVTLKDGKFSTDLYVKPTDTHQFLHPSSCHPYHCKKAIPFS